MFDAVDSGKLSLDILEGWLHEIEGWGDQHIYLYDLPAKISQNKLWKNRKSVERVTEQKGLSKFWGTSSSMAFPNKLKLTEISFDGNIFRVVWHKGLSSWIRYEDKDFEKKEGVDIYQYRAFRSRSKRSVVRFEWIKDKNIAVIFLQSSFEKTVHQKIQETVFEVVKNFFDINSFALIDVDKAIKKLDQKALPTADGQSSKISSQETRFMAGGASVEFRSDVPGAGYNRVAAVRHVRRGVQTNSFTGSLGIFVFRREGLSNISRNIKVQLYSKQNRMRFWHRSTREDVWTILEYIKQCLN